MIRWQATVSIILTLSILHLFYNAFELIRQLSNDQAGLAESFQLLYLQ